MKSLWVMSPVIFTILLLLGYAVYNSDYVYEVCGPSTSCRMMTRMSTQLEAITDKLKKQTNQLEDLRNQLDKTRTSVLDQLSKQSEEIPSHSAYFLPLQDKMSLDESNHGAKIGPRDCNDVKDMGVNQSGSYQIYPGSDYRRLKTTVVCDMSSPNETWLVFQRRKHGIVGFERTWLEYEKGFGNIYGEFWLGNDILSLLTTNRKYKLRIEMEDFSGEKRYSEYSTFSVRPATDKYRLTVSGYSGTAGDSLTVHSGMRFTTKDVDNDVSSNNCAQTFRGAWWYRDCHQSNLNGLYQRGPHTSYADGIEWFTWHGHFYSLKTVEMKITAVA